MIFAALLCDTPSPSPLTERTHKQAVTSFQDVSAALVFDVVHDCEYRKKWDHDMLDMKEICKVSVNNTVSYYAGEKRKLLNSPL